MRNSCRPARHSNRQFAGLNQIQKIPAILETLQQNIASQPDTFQVGWTFEGTKHFTSVEPKLARYREWLSQSFL